MFRWYRRIQASKYVTHINAVHSHNEVKYVASQLIELRSLLLANFQLPPISLQMHIIAGIIILTEGILSI